MDTVTMNPAAAPDKAQVYRKVVKQAICAVAATIPSDEDVHTVCAFDEQRDQYLLLCIGWSGQKRHRSIILYLRVRAGKIWIEHDMIEDGITPALLEAGVPKEDIVLGFQPPSMRKYTEFAEG
jgi:hypothetical protein